MTVGSYQPLRKREQRSHVEEADGPEPKLSCRGTAFGPDTPANLFDDRRKLKGANSDSFNANLQWHPVKSARKLQKPAARDARWPTTARRRASGRRGAPIKSSASAFQRPVPSPAARQCLSWSFSAKSSRTSTRSSRICWLSCTGTAWLCMRAPCRSAWPRWICGHRLSC